MIFLFKDKVLILASFFAFLLLNIIENLVQFTIGRKPESKKIISITKPSREDWVKIIIVTLIFAVLQGVFTSLFNFFFHKEGF